MNKFQELLVAGLIAAIATGAVAGIVVWMVTTKQQDFVARQFEAQSAKIQSVGDELARTAGDLKRLDGALKTTEATLREVKDQVALVGTRTGIAQLATLAETANKTLAEIKQATAPEQANAALAPLGEKLDTTNKTLEALAPLGTKLDDANKTLAALAPLNTRLDAAQKALAALQTRLDDMSGNKARDEALARIETALAGVKDALASQASSPALTQANAKLDEALKSLAAIGKTTDALKGNVTDTAKLDEAAKSLAAIKETLGAIKSGADAHAAKLDAASKSLTALDASVKQGFADVTSKQSDVVKAVTKPAAAAPQPARTEQDLVVFYVSMAAKSAPPPAPAAPATTAAIGLTPPVPPPFAVRFERLGKVDDEGQTKAIIGKVHSLIKGHSGCTIAVTGHADTFGGDRRNYELSKRRANEVADQLKTAFAADDNVKVSRTQWGERRLKEWTPDGVTREANRRVDVSVSCEN